MRVAFFEKISLQTQHFSTKNIGKVLYFVLQKRSEIPVLIKSNHEKFY